jgi:phenylacetyl-CoA:acceptor oxidoreductase subunit 2
MTRHLERRQTHWDWRAAGNFVCGGAGAGLVAVSAAAGAHTTAGRATIAAGLALVGLGLLLVWLEIGRPRRALNVFAHLRRSWMSREAAAALALLGLGAGLAAGRGWPAWPALLAALFFLYCQARILSEARAIPAWRAPLVTPLVVTTGLAEGLGLFCLLAAWQRPPLTFAAALAATVAARWILWSVWRATLRVDAPAAAMRAIDRDAWAIRWLGGVAPLALAAAGGLAGGAAGAALLGAAGLAAAAGGAVFKYSLITQACAQHGFGLPRMPVRGVPRTPA